jgi:Integrase core domain
MDVDLSTLVPPSTSTSSSETSLRTTTTAQSYTGIKPSVSIFPTVNGACSLASCISVPTTLENLRTLEHIHSQVYPGDILVPPAVQKPLKETRTHDPRKKCKFTETAKRNDNTVSLGSGEMDTEVPKDWNYDAEVPANWDLGDELDIGSYHWSVNPVTLQASSNIMHQSDNNRSLRNTDTVDTQLYYYNCAANDEHYACCTDCKELKEKRKKLQHWIMDSGASLHFTNSLNNFAEYTIGEYGHAITATTVVKITAVGTVLLAHNIRGQDKTQITRVYPVYYFEGLKTRLLLMGTLLQNGLLLRGSSEDLIFFKDGKPMLSCLPHKPRLTLYWLTMKVVSDKLLRAVPVIFIAMHETWHKQLGHPSKEVLRHCHERLIGFPKKFKLSIPDSKICPGCLQGKMTKKPFPASETHAVHPFNKVHTDLKEFATLSYHKYKWIVTFFDDCTSYGWTVATQSKTETNHIMKQSAPMVAVQFNAVIKIWQIDGGSEFGKAFQHYVKEAGIQVQISAPYMHEQHGRAERFNRTIMEKVQALRFDTCLPLSWWEFFITHAVHLYNCTPISCLLWATPFELLRKEKPDVANLRVFGCLAYVYVPKEKHLNKLSPRSEKMTYIGYAEGYKGFHFMTEKNSIFVSTTATFDKTVYPHCLLKPKPCGFTPIEG